MALSSESSPSGEASRFPLSDAIIQTLGSPDTSALPKIQLETGDSAPTPPVVQRLEFLQAMLTEVNGDNPSAYGVSRFKWKTAHGRPVHFSSTRARQGQNYLLRLPNSEVSLWLNCRGNRLVVGESESDYEAANREKRAPFDRTQDVPSDHPDAIDIANAFAASFLATPEYQQYQQQQEQQRAERALVAANAALSFSSLPVERVLVDQSA